MTDRHTQELAAYELTVDNLRRGCLTGTPRLMTGRRTYPRLANHQLRRGAQLYDGLSKHQTTLPEE